MVVFVLMAVAVLCLVGPGRLFPKEPFEGPTLMVVAPHHGLTALDVPGLACAGAAILLGGRSVWERVRKH